MSLSSANTWLQLLRTNEATEASPVVGARIGRPPATGLASEDDATLAPSQLCAAEQYRMARTRILHHPKHPAFLVVSSPNPEDGKTFTSLQLALLFARRGEDHVLLIDADLRRPNLHEWLDLPPGPGLAEVLEQRCSLDAALCPVKDLPALSVLTAGTPTRNPAELFNSARWTDLLVAVRSRFQFQIVDSPPLGAVADTDLLTSACDGLLLVVRPNHTPRDLLARSLACGQNKLLGVILNGVEEWSLWKPYASSYYHYGSARSRR